MFKRLLTEQIQTASRAYKSITLVGPRQSGKTTLSKFCFPDYDYINFETPSNRQRFLSDPTSFLQGLKKSTILDEAQKVPEILSYLQEILDDENDKRKFVITGSNNLLLSEKVSQSLAGRTKIFHVLPLSFEEIDSKIKLSTLEHILLGGYPDIHQKNLPPFDWGDSYLQTYIEKDVRQISEVANLRQFSQFVRLCAGRVGQLFSASSISNDLGVNHVTLKKWLGILETSYVLFTLPPYFKNFNKRLVKTPKVYFFDTALACYLLGIKTKEDLLLSPHLGSLYENWIILRFLKNSYNQGIKEQFYFWRDQTGHEIDLIQDSNILSSVEIKLSKTFCADHIKNLNWFAKISKPESSKKLIYGGDEAFSSQSVKIYPWNSSDIYEQ